MSLQHWCATRELPVLDLALVGSSHALSFGTVGVRKSIAVYQSGCFASCFCLFLANVSAAWRAFGALPVLQPVVGLSGPGVGGIETTFKPFVVWTLSFSFWRTSDANDLVCLLHIR